MQGWEILDEVAKQAGLTVAEPTLGSTVGGIHAVNSWHYVGQARDYGYDSDADGIARLFRPAAVGDGFLLHELFGSDGTGHDDGRPYQAPGHTGDHTHAAIRAGVTVEELSAAVGALGATTASPSAAIPGGSRQPSPDGGPSPFKLFTILTSPGGWVRMLEVVGGAALVGFGLWSLAAGGAGAALGDIRRTVKTVAEGAGTVATGGTGKVASVAGKARTVAGKVAS